MGLNLLVILNILTGLQFKALATVSTFDPVEEEYLPALSIGIDSTFSHKEFQLLPSSQTKTSAKDSEDHWLAKNVIPLFLNIQVGKIDISTMTASLRLTY